VDGNHRAEFQLGWISAFGKEECCGKSRRTYSILRVYPNLPRSIVPLSDSDVVSAEISDFILKRAIERAVFEGWEMPFFSDSGFHTAFGYVVGTAPFKSEGDYRNYLKRLSLLAEFLEQHQENMQSGLAAGFTQPQAILEKALLSFDALVTATKQASSNEPGCDSI